MHARTCMASNTPVHTTSYIRHSRYLKKSTIYPMHGPFGSCYDALKTLLPELGVRYFLKCLTPLAEARRKKSEFKHSFLLRLFIFGENFSKLKGGL